MGSKRKWYEKAFLNEKGEISFRKTGAILGGIGLTLASGKLSLPEGVVSAIIKEMGVLATAIGGIFTMIGQFEKNDRATQNPEKSEE